MASFGKIVLMLSSDQAGEVVAAAHAIEERLAREGYDWHWFAEQADRVIANGKFNNGRGGTAHNAARNKIDHQAAADWLLDHFGSVLTPYQRGFCETMAGWVGEPTEKQATWLASLLRRYGYRP